MLQSKVLRLGLLVLCVVAIGFNAWFFRPNPHGGKRDDGRIWLNKDEFSFNQIHDHIAGDPKKTVEQMRNVIYRDMQTYYRRNKHYPLYTSNQNAIPPFEKDRREAYKEYGYASPREAFLGHINTDAQYADGTFRAKNVDPYMHPLVRPDRTKFGDPKAPGTRDILAFTQIYFYHNQRYQMHGNDTITEKPVGFYLVLWEDGQIEKVDWEKVRCVRSTGYPCFPGQAGVPADALPYMEQRKWAVTPEGLAAVRAQNIKDGL